MIDYFTNTIAPTTTNSPMTISDNTFGTINTIASLSIPNYPLNSQTKLSQKMTMTLIGGYAATTPAPLAMIGYTPIWYNPTINYYVYQQQTVAINSPLTLSLKNLTNP